MGVVVYSLPDEIKHHEQIIFGLNWKQAVKITVYTGLAAPLLRTGLPTKLKAGSALLIVATGVLLTLTGFDKKLFQMLRFQLSFSEAGYLDKNAFKFTGIQEIKNSYIERRNGEKIAVLQVEPINLQVKAEEQRKQILASYRKFLNSLDFPLTVHVRKADSLPQIQDYYEKLENQVVENREETGNTDLELLFQEHRQFFEKYVEENASSQTLYYIIVPAPAQENQVQELNQRVQLVRENLMPVGIETRRLETGELVSFAASYFEQFVEKDQDYLFPVTTLQKSRGA